MSYKLKIKGSFRRRLKKLPEVIQEEVKSIIEKKILLNPTHLGEPLKNIWRPALKYSFNRRPEYRIIYYVEKCNVIDKDKNIRRCEYNICRTKEELDTCEGQVVFMLVDTREAFKNLYNSKRSEIKRYLSYY